MDQSVTILQEIVRTVYKTEETLKTIESCSEPPCKFYAEQLSTILDKIKISSLLTSYEIINGIEKRELNESIQIIFECVETGEKVYSTLQEAYSGSVPGNLQEQLEKNMQSLGLMLAQLSSLQQV